MSAGYQRMTGTFDLKPNTAPLGAKPDELMIDWTTLPKGSKASIYLPTAEASGILEAAARIHGFQPFSRIDPHTIACEARGYVYVPMPNGEGGLAGLLDVALPSHVPIGQRLTTAARQLTSKNALVSRQRSRVDYTFVPGESANIVWRTAAGSFQLALKVENEDRTRKLIERKLSILRWIFQTIPTNSRWRPVFIRYIGVVAQQLSAAGGEPRNILPYNPAGPSQGGPGRERGRCVVGKIEGLIFDHFGDFEGFILETEEDERFEFFSRERNLREVAERAWRDRLRVTVFGEGPAERRVRRIVLHSAPASI